MVIGTYQVFTLKGRRANMEVSLGPLSFDQELKFAFPVFSEHFEERDVRTPRGDLAGRDRWGYLKSGDRWRRLRFFSGEEVGYRPASPKEASLFDHVVSSACLLPATDH